MLSLRTILVLLVLVYAWKRANSSSSVCDSGCELPSCYCDRYTIPGGLRASETPQMVLFTFSDRVTGTVRKSLIDIFPDTLKNPISECPVTITVFTLGSGTDYCAVHRLYTRGHEIASYGRNRTGQTEGWTEFDWEKLFADHQEEMTEKAFLPDDHVRGVRTPLQKPGGNQEFSMLYTKGFLYDATLLAGWQSLNSAKQPSWPVTLDVPWYPCLTPTCPNKSYDGFWEMPLLRLVNTENGRLCAFLDDCVTTFKTAKDVFRFLYKNFRHHYETNRAPMQINIATKTLKNKVAVAGLKLFLKTIVSDGHDDTWVITMQDAIQWMEYPTPISKLADMNLWTCEDRNFHRCDTEDDALENGRHAKPTSPFRAILFVDQLWIFQLVFLIVSYFLIRQYDKMKYKKQP